MLSLNQKVDNFQDNAIKSESVSKANEISNELNENQINELRSHINEIVSINGRNFQVLDNNGDICLVEVEFQENQAFQEKNIASDPNSDVDYEALYETIMKDPQSYANNIIIIKGNQYQVKVNKRGTAEFIKYIQYKCPSCSKICNNANSLTKHYLEIHQEKIFVCRNCPKIFQALTDLFLHARQDHKDPEKPQKDPSQYRYQCNFPGCDYMTNNGGTFEHHRRAHTKEKPYPCKFCNKTFSQKTNRNTHQSRHNNEKKFPCEICKKQFKTYDIYLSHLRTREHELREHSENLIETMVEVICLGCNKTLSKLFDIKKHIKECNIKLDYNYMCKDCKCLLIDFEDLRKHLKTHKDTMLISCPVCNASGFDHMNKLNHHITRTHDMKVERKEVCRYCENTFEKVEELKEHVKQYHAGEVNSRKSRGAIGRYICEYEGCTFTANTEMHMRSHRSQHERGIIGGVKPEPKKRGRKRKLPDTRNIFDQLCATDDIKSEISCEALSKQELFNSNTPTPVKRKRGRPKKIDFDIKSENIPQLLPTSHHEKVEHPNLNTFHVKTEETINL